MLDTTEGLITPAKVIHESVGFEVWHCYRIGNAFALIHASNNLCIGLYVVKKCSSVQSDSLMLMTDVFR